MSSKVLGALCVIAMGYMIALGLDLAGFPNPIHSETTKVVVTPAAAHKVEDRLPKANVGCETFDGVCLDMDQDYVDDPSAIKVPNADFEYIWSPHYQTV